MQEICSNCISMHERLVLLGSHFCEVSIILLYCLFMKMLIELFSSNIKWAVELN